MSDMTRDDVIRSTAQHIRTVGKYLAEAAHNLTKRAVVHDQSKWSPEEWPFFERATPQLARLTYGSAEYRAALSDIKPAIDHHNAVNSHHPEHNGRHICVQCGADDREQPCTCGGSRRADMSRMSLLDLIEMLCDWKAASERHDNGSLPRSIAQNAERFGYDDKFALMLARTACELGMMTEVEFQSVPIVEPAVPPGPPSPPRTSRPKMWA